MAVRPTRHTESYDSACQELAAHFVMGEKGSVEHLGRRVHSLAGAVQEAVESWLAINPPLDGSVTSDARIDAP